MSSSQLPVGLRSKFLLPVAGKFSRTSNCGENCLLVCMCVCAQALAALDGIAGLHAAPVSTLLCLMLSGYSSQCFCVVGLARGGLRVYAHINKALGYDC